MVRGNRAFDTFGDEASADRGFEQRIAGETVCAMKSRAGGFAAGPKPFDGAAAFRIHFDAAHVIMRRRPDRDRLVRRIDAGVGAKRGDRGKARGEIEPLDVARIEKDAMTRRHVAPDRAGDDIARREFGAGHGRHKARACLVDQDCAFAAHRFADEFQREAGGIERRRMELDEFEIGKLRAGARREREALAEGARRIGAMLKEAADAARRDDDAACRQKQRMALRPLGENAAHRAIFDKKAARGNILDHGDRRRRAHRFGERADDFAPRRVAARMNDALAAMRGLKPETK